MKRLITSILLLACAAAHADGYDTMRIDFPAEHTAKLFAGCELFPNNLPQYVIWCQGTYAGTYVEPPNAGKPVLFGTIDPGLGWYSDLMGACRLHAQEDHGTYTFFWFSCYTDRISSDGFEPAGLD